MTRPVRPTTSTITLGLHTLEITWCTICHAVTKITLLGAPNPTYARSLDFIEDMHYAWHERLPG